MSALLVLAALSACGTGQDRSVDASPVREPAPAEAADPMASFARMLPGEWRVTYESGMSQIDTWHRGPGGHSLRVMTDGTDAGGSPWRELLVLYWHPGRKQVRLLGLNPFAGSVMEGMIKLEGEAADAEIDMYQTGGRRELGLRWTFDGPDRYRETLLEASGPAGLQPIVAWDYVRSRGPAATRPSTTDEAARPSERLALLGSLVGHTWEARGEWGSGEIFHVQSTVAWIPYVDAVYMRTVVMDGGPTHLLDAYFYHHTGTGALRCLALSNRGGVYEGDLTVQGDGALQLALDGHEGDRVVSHVVRLDRAQDGTLRHRHWSPGGAEPTLVLDVQHRKLVP